VPQYAAPANDREIMILIILTYLLCLWLTASAASRGQGHFVVLAGLLALGVGLLAFARGRRPVLYALSFLMLLAAIAAALFEGALRLRPGILGGQVANVAYTGYHWHRGGIYTLDPHVGPLMKPNVRRRMYWAGHWWTHEANSRGFRGPCPARTEVVFLGDSMIYGHGVENEATAPSRFAQLTGLGTANLGQQGTSLPQSALIFERKGVPLRPRVVFVCAHPTDIEDAITSYDPQMLARWLASAPGSFEPLVRQEYQPRARWSPARLWLEEIALPLHAGGVSGALWRSWRAGLLRARQESPGGDERFVPVEVEKPFAAPDAAPGSDERVSWEAQKRALREIQRAATAIGARVVVFDLGYPREFSRAVEGAAAELGLAYSPAGRRVLERALAGEDLYLARDGHWNPAGSDAIARELAPLVTAPTGAPSKGLQ
jgi:hypothetical protein